jgi:cell division protein ZapA
MEERPQKAGAALTVQQEERREEMPPAESIEVTIFNQTYVLRSPSGDEHVRRVAAVVDARMRQIASSITTHDVTKVAILAALNIADEMQSIKDRYAAEMEQLIAQSAAGQAAEMAAEGGETAGKVGGGDGAGASWFDDIFEGDMTPTRDRGSRLSSQVSAKLQSLRRNDAPAQTIEESDPSP